MDLPPEPASVRLAREAVGDSLRRAGYEGDIDVALLLTSEIVTNAVRHATATTPITLTVCADREGAWVGVGDGDPRHVPVGRPVETHRDTGGRGLHILDQMSRDWGVDTNGSSKTVWFTVT